MREDYEKIFSHLAKPELPDGLLGQVMDRLVKEQKLVKLKTRLTVFSVSFLVSMAIMIPAFNMVRAELASSGFSQFFSLLFSDLTVVTADWQNFVFSLLETLPAISLIVFLIVILVSLESLKLLVKNLSLFFITRKLINT